MAGKKKQTKGKKTQAQINREPRPIAFFDGDFAVIQSDHSFSRDIVMIEKAKGWCVDPLNDNFYEVVHVVKRSPKPQPGRFVVSEKVLRVPVASEMAEVAEMFQFSDEGFLLLHEMSSLQTKLRNVYEGRNEEFIPFLFRDKWDSFNFKKFKAQRFFSESDIESLVNLRSKAIANVNYNLRKFGLAA